MSRIGDLLELMQGADRRFGSLRAVLREWTDVPRWEAACQQLGSRRQVSDYVGDSPTAEMETVEETRLWLEKSSRLRVERTREGESQRITVHDGPRWWDYDSQSGLESNEGREEIGDALHERYQDMLDPARLLPLLELEPLSDVEVVGRPAVAAVARPRRGNVPGLEWLMLVGDEHEIAVDREIGVILRLESRLANYTFSTVEFVEIEFDPVLPQHIWTLVPPSRGA
jgi:outer membrane lipoprotein-sorting protein